MDFRELLDDLLEISVLGSFSRPGYVARRRLFNWSPAPPDALRGRTIAVTGPTSGLGRAAALAFANLGARVLLLGRDAKRLELLRAELVERHTEDWFPTFVVDMASLASVRSAVATVVAGEPRLDVLVDNAGAIFASRAESPDGIEATLATMVVGPFALIAGLLPLLQAAGGGGRVVSVTSGGMYTQAVNLADLQWELEDFSGPRAYARAKRIQVALIREWARRTAGSGLVFSAMHPGWADTPGLAGQLPGFYRLMRPLLRSPADGADTIVWLATEPDGSALNGRLFLDRRARPFNRAPGTRLSAAQRRRLWDVVVSLARVEDPTTPWLTGAVRPSRVEGHPTDVALRTVGGR
jgi:NAD(P)-dependent dehydrogenase (short-subunit alcohol dehydrogenase family)